MIRLLFEIPLIIIIHRSVSKVRLYNDVQVKFTIKFTLTCYYHSGDLLKSLNVYEVYESRKTEPYK